MPFLFYYYGPALRARSKYAPSAPKKLEKIPTADSTATAVDLYVPNEKPHEGTKPHESNTKLHRKITIPEDEALEPEYGSEAGEDSHGPRRVPISLASPV